MSARTRRPARQYATTAPADPYGGAYEGEAWYEDERPARTVTPARVLLFLLAVIAGAVALYGAFLDRTPLQIPLTVSGLAVLGVTLLLLALASARSAAALGRSGSGGRAFLAAFFGGLCALGASGSLAGAIVLGIVALSA